LRTAEKDGGKARPPRELLWGSEALAIGLIDAGLDTLSAHESIKAAEVAIACEARRGGRRPAVEVHMSAPRAVESAIAAASQGRPAAVVLPSRAFAAGAAPLHAFCERGTTAGLAVVLIEDPGCEMTPGEIDSRYLARELYMPVLEPSSIEELQETARVAPQLSERWGQPVMLRVGVRLLDTRSLVSPAPKKASKESKDGAASAPPPPTGLGAYGGQAATDARVRRLDAVSAAMESLPLNRAVLTPPSDMLIVAVGAAYGATRDALSLIGMESTVQLVKLGTSYPLPRALLASHMRKAKRCLVVEELEPYVETRLSEIANKEGISVQVRGKVFIARGGELTPWDVADGLGRFAGLTPPVDEKRVETLDRVVREALPPRAPSLPPAHAFRAALEAAGAFAAASGAWDLIVEAPPEWRAALAGSGALYLGDWGEGLGVACAVARRQGARALVVTEGRGIVAGLSALREAKAESLQVLALVSPQGLSAAVERALPGAHHHVLNLRALSQALGLEASAIVEIGPAGPLELGSALRQAAASSGKGPTILAFEAPEAPGGKGL